MMRQLAVNLMRLGRFGTVALAPIALAGCAGPLSALDPAGPSAGSIAQIWYAMLIGATVLFALVLGLFFLALLRPGLSWNEGRLSRSVLWLGLAMPTAVLTGLMIYALWGGERLLAHPSDGATVVEARGERWRWVFTYPDIPGAGETVDVLHIPAGQPVDVVIRSSDVIHSFWVPRLAGKLDAIPGHENRLRIAADRPGVYHGQCSEYCGVGHQSMRFTVEAHAADAFEPAVRAATGGQP